MIQKVSEEERERRQKLAVGCATRYIVAQRKRNPRGVTREAEIIALAAVGHTDEEAGAILKIEVSTAGTYWKRIIARFGARTRTEAVSTVLLLEIFRLREKIVELRAELDECNRRSTSEKT